MTFNEIRSLRKKLGYTIQDIVTEYNKSWPYYIKTSVASWHRYERNNQEPKANVFNKAKELMRTLRKKRIKELT